MFRLVVKIALAAVFPLILLCPVAFHRYGYPGALRGFVSVLAVAQRRLDDKEELSQYPNLLVGCNKHWLKFGVR